MYCPTVTIQTEPSDGNPTGHVVINASDYNAETMTLVNPEEAPKAPEAPPAPPEAPVAQTTTAPPAPPAPVVAETTPPKVVAPWAAK